MRAHLAIGIILAVSISALSWAQDTAVSGTVTDETGHPIAGVLVIGDRHNAGGGYTQVTTVTNGSGGFALNNVGRVICFRKSGFQPYVTVRESSDSNTDAALRSATPTPPFPECTGKLSRRKRGGMQILFDVPRGAKVKQLNDADTWKDVITFSKNPTERMVIESGIMLGGLTFPDEWLLLNASSVTGRWLDAGAAMDFRGRTKEGRQWRFLGSAFSIATYNNADPDAARFFDGIIDSACRRVLPEARN